MKVKVSYKLAGTRSSSVGRGFLNSIPRYDEVTDDFNQAKALVCYGASPTHVHWYNNNPDKHIVFIDLGYWKRGSQRDNYAHYKVSLGHWHPDLSKLPSLPNDRMKKQGIKITRQRRGGNILLAGLGPKGSQLYKYEHQDWDKRMVEEIRKYTDRPIVYRPKPSDHRAPEIDGTIYHHPLNTDLDAEFKNSWAVVTHHSNVGVEAVQRNLPMYTQYGPAKQYSMPDLSHIEDVAYDMPDREQFFSKLAYCNWSVNEIRNGQCWEFIRQCISQQN
jgi:hypothetical protein